MDLRIHFDCFDFLVQSDLSGILENVRDLFGDRASYVEADGSDILSCSVIEDGHGFESIAERVDFSGPQIFVSPGIYLSYAFCPPKIYMQVSSTGIAEWDENILGKSIFRLAPQYRSSYIPNTGTRRTSPTPLPEAFLYPIMAEAVRDVGACLIHCGCVVHEGRVVLLTGPPRSGKSTHVLRMVQRGAHFLADDLAIVRRGESGPRLHAFREVANVHEATVDFFRELSFLRDSPRRGDDKFVVNIMHSFGQKAASNGRLGVILRLHPDQEAWMRPCLDAERFRGLHNMAWFVSRRRASEDHFSLLLDLLMDAPQWEVSQGYMRQNLDELLPVLTETFR